MKIMRVSLGASVLLACGSEPGVDATIYLNPPTNDNSCVGVAGFEVSVSPTGRAAKTQQAIGMRPILNADSCALSKPLAIQDLEIETPVTVTVTGYDGAGTARVSATKSMNSLRDGPFDLQLESVARPPPPLPVLVIYRNPLLQGTPLSSVDTIFVSTQKQPTGILTVERDRAMAYFDPEPGAYAVSQTQVLAPGGGSTGTAITVTFRAQGQTIKEQKLNATWKDTFYEATPQP